MHPSRFRLRFGSWAFETALRFDQHLADWVVTDQVSGTSGAVDDYLIRGIHLGLSRRFK